MHSDSLLTIWNFNPRSREGSDSPAVCRRGSDEYFNPRSREGSDDMMHAYYGMRQVFQSTLPRRERQQKSPRLFPMIFTK